MKNSIFREWRVALIGTAALALGVLSSGANAQSSNLLGQNGNKADDVNPYLRIDEAGVWPGLNIPVCWEQSATPYPEERGIVERGVRKHIEGNSAFRFGEKWPQCGASTGATIRISTNDAQAESLVGYQTRLSLLGAPIPGPTTMNLNFVFGAWSKSCAKPEAYRKQCIETIAVHEFLHALGVLHEQLSKELPVKDPVCWALYKDAVDVQGLKPKALTDYDPDSIMNYCRKIYAEPTRLSKLDKEGLLDLEKRAREKGKTQQVSSSDLK